jgi:hypothetical protein
LRWATTFPDFDCAGREAGVALLFCGFAGAVLRAGDVLLLAAALLDVAALEVGGAALRAGALFVGGVFFDVLPLEEAISLAFVALRAGAFSAAERLMIGFGRAAVDFVDTVRLFPEDVEGF